ncbi:MAG: metal-independent alpha-mannosidase [Candidatus Meridianibacter frigidus]|nr:MAG: metal-independent alpha-mannosidase [Candidatus Eremiobacteraeota bacterium]
MQPRFGGERFLRVPLSGRRFGAITTTSLFHTLFNDFVSEGDGTTYVQTGDIPAMWLRDSSAQTIPYVRFQKEYPKLRERFAGVIERNTKNILVDPYANAFYPDYRVWERKWEADSLAFTVMLDWVYWEQTGDRMVFTKNLHAALGAIVQTYACEQEHRGCSRYNLAVPTQTSYNYAGGTGMVWCAFRPSDDAVRFHFNIPQQIKIVVAMRELASMAVQGFGDTRLAQAAVLLASEIEGGIQRYGRVYHPRLGWIYVYETDGEGHHLLMDDANLPDLLSIAYLGYRSSGDPAYLATRAFVLSRENAYYFTGTYAAGLGSTHTPKGWVWPMGIITRALTATSQSEVIESITTLAETDSEEGLMHESFDPNAYWHFTRAEFGWANALYADLIFRSAAGLPNIDFNPQEPTPLFAASRTPVLGDVETRLENALRLSSALGDLLRMLH